MQEGGGNKVWKRDNFSTMESKNKLKGLFRIACDTYLQKYTIGKRAIGQAGRIAKDATKLCVVEGSIPPKAGRFSSVNMYQLGLQGLIRQLQQTHERLDHATLINMHHSWKWPSKNYKG